MRVVENLALLCRTVKPRHLLLVLAVVGAAVGGRAVLEAVAPGMNYFSLLIPAVVLAGALLGTGAGALVAVTGFLCIVLLFSHPALLIGRPINVLQADAMLFVFECIAVLWVTHVLRRSSERTGSTNARLTEVFRQIPGAAAVLEAPTGRLLMRSEHSEAVLGHAARKLERSDDMISYGGIHADGRHYAAHEYPIVRALKGEIVRAEFIKYVRPDGSIVDLEVHAGPVRAVDGRIIASVGMAFDVTDRLDAERRLRESEAQQRAVIGRLQAAVDAGSLGLWEVDLVTNKISFDASFAGMIGLAAQPTEMKREEFRALIVPEERERAASVFQGAATKGGLYSDEFPIRTLQGNFRWLVCRGVVLVDVQKVVGVANDLTERRERENALQAALEARGILMQEADHRIKNSLQLVVAMLRLQRDRLADPDAKQALTEAIARVDAIGNVHRALQNSPNLRVISVDQMLEDLSTFMGSLNKSIQIKCVSNTGLWLDADRAIPLGLLVNEVLTNALKHAYPMGVAGGVSVSATTDNAILQLVISDCGVGLPIDVSRAGLGATLVATLTKQIGGTVTTQSQPGQGTTVLIQCDIAPASAN